MNIAMFTDSYGLSDGVSNSISRLKEGLVKRGHEVYIFAPSKIKSGYYENDKTFYFFGLPFLPYPEYVITMKKNINRLIENLKINLVHIHTPGLVGTKALMVSRDFGIPSIFTYHTDIFTALPIYTRFLPVRLTTYLLKDYIRWFIRRVNGFIVPSKYILNQLRRILSEVEWKKPHWVVPTGLKIEDYIFDQNYKPVPPYRILSVGRVAREKNLEIIIDAMNFLPSGYTLVIAGKGPALDYYKRYVRNKKLDTRVHFLGFVSEERLRYLYSHSDGFVIASKFDTQGMVIHEAFASGLPVACINEGAVREFVTPGVNGYLFEEDPEHCAHIIKKIIKNRTILSSRCRESVKKYSVDNFVQQMIQMYNVVLNA